MAIDLNKFTLKHVESLTIWETNWSLPKAIYYFVSGHLRLGGRDLTSPKNRIVTPLGLILAIFRMLALVDTS
jgi:hypothetical protein